MTRLGKNLLLGYFLLELFTFSANKQFQNMICCSYFNIKRSWVQMFWTFNLSFNNLATVLATFPNIGRMFVQISGHSIRWALIGYFKTPKINIFRPSNVV